MPSPLRLSSHTSNVPEQTETTKTNRHRGIYRNATVYRGRTQSCCCSSLYDGDFMGTCPPRISSARKTPEMINCSSYIIATSIIIFAHRLRWYMCSLIAGTFRNSPRCSTKGKFVCVCVCVCVYCSWECVTEKYGERMDRAGAVDCDKDYFRLRYLKFYEYVSSRWALEIQRHNFGQHFCGSGKKATTEQKKNHALSGKTVGLSTELTESLSLWSPIVNKRPNQILKKKQPKKMDHVQQPSGNGSRVGLPNCDP